jgi:hypothetical protein
MRVQATEWRNTADGGTSVRSVHSTNKALWGAALGLILVAAVVLLGLLVIAPLRNTRTAPGYTERAFRTIKVGDSEERVIDMLGEPLERAPSRSDPSYIYLWYAKPIGPSENHLLRNVVVRDGEVTQVYRQIWLD